MIEIRLLSNCNDMLQFNFFKTVQRDFFSECIALSDLLHAL